MHWHDSLAYRVTPKSGPLHSMDTLLDANRSIAGHLPGGYLKREHWRNAGWALVRAAESGKRSDVATATEALVLAIESEGWMNPDRREARIETLQECLEALSGTLRECLTPRISPDKPVLKVIDGFKNAASHASPQLKHGAAMQSAKRRLG